MPVRNLCVLQLKKALKTVVLGDQKVTQPYKCAIKTTVGNRTLSYAGIVI